MIRWVKILSALACVSGLLFSESLIERMGRIKSVRTLLLQRLPEEYTVPVTLKGDLGKRVETCLDSMGFDSPGFYETYSRDEGFNLYIDNENMPPYTHRMISGILNPIEMSNVILNTFTSYRKYSVMKDLLKETVVKRKTIKEDGVEFLVMEFSPRDEKFKYASIDNGPAIRESWLDTMALKIKGTMEVKEVMLVKHNVLHYNNKKEKTRVKQGYSFDYKKIGKTLLPLEMRLFTDDTLSLKVNAEYRIADEEILFKNREIVFLDREGNERRLIIEYGKYVFDSKRVDVREGQGDGFSEEIIRAAEIAGEAQEALSEGEMDRAYLMYRRLLRRYPETPQAVEARELLKGL
ncbi:MAG: tetratricopeptide repeat protein [Chitinivibrionales bacterium]